MSTTKILLVEDDTISALITRKKLENQGYSIVGIASECEDAVQLAKQHSPHLCLLDLNLQSDTGGIETAKKIRAFLDIPMIFLTGSTETDMLKDLMKINPALVIIKPFRDPEFMCNLEIVLHKHQSAEDMQKVNCKLKETIQELEAHNLDLITKLEKAGPG